MTIRPDPDAVAAMQYLMWALEFIEKTADRDAAHHVRLALEALRKRLPGQSILESTRALADVPDHVRPLLDRPQPVGFVLVGIVNRRRRDQLRPSPSGRGQCRHPQSSEPDGTEGRAVDLRAAAEARARAVQACRAAARAARNAWKNRSRCAASSRAQPCIVASVRSVRRISREPPKAKFSIRNPEKRKLQIYRSGAVARSRHLPWPPEGPRETDGQRKGRLRCHKRPKSREETPQGGQRIARGVTANLAKTIAIGGSIERREASST